MGRVVGGGGGNVGREVKERKCKNQQYHLIATHGENNENWHLFTTKSATRVMTQNEGVLRAWRTWHNRCALY